MTTIEFESGAIHDFNALLDELAPRDADYRHHLRWHDDNGSSHVRAALLGPSLTVPFVSGALILGTWQQIMLLELDTRGRERDIVVQVMGDSSGVQASGPRDVQSQNAEPRGESRPAWRPSDGPVYGSAP